jgi:cytochrome c biogenesis protein CcdA
MKIFSWALSGIALGCICPVLVVLEAMALGGAHLSKGTYDLIWYSFLLVPIVWLVALILSIVEAKRKNRPKRMRLYYSPPFATRGLHIVILILGPRYRP